MTAPTGRYRVDNQVTPGDTQWFDTETDAHEYAARLVRAGARAVVVWLDTANYESEDVA